MDIGGYNMPEDLYYEPNHWWVKQDGDLLVMGMDDFAQKLAGEIVYVQLPDDGKKITAGKKLAKVESGKWLGKVIAPGQRRDRLGQRGTGGKPRFDQ